MTHSRRTFLKFIAVTSAAIPTSSFGHDEDYDDGFDFYEYYPVKAAEPTVIENPKRFIQFMDGSTPITNMAAAEFDSSKDGSATCRHERMDITETRTVAQPVVVVYDEAGEVLAKYPTQITPSPCVLYGGTMLLSAIELDAVSLKVICP